MFTTVLPIPGRWRWMLELPSAQGRVDGLAAIMWDQDVTLLDDVRRLLDDDAPVLYGHAGRLVVSEVRNQALEAAEYLCACLGGGIDLGPVQVRPAVPVDDVVAEATEALASLPVTTQADVRARVDAILRERVQPPPDHVAGAQAYVTLQQLGRITYQEQHVDPQTYLTPLQESIIRTQFVSPRPVPHLRFRYARKPSLVIGYVGCENGQWYEDLTSCHVALDLRRHTTQFSEQNAVPRVCFDERGQPRRNAHGGLVIEGTLPLDGSDPIEVLRSMQALTAPTAPSDLVTERP